MDVATVGFKVVRNDWIRLLIDPDVQVNLISPGNSGRNAVALI
jgi:hypothetical protein